MGCRGIHKILSVRGRAFPGDMDGGGSAAHGRLFHSGGCNLVRSSQSQTQSLLRVGLYMVSVLLGIVVCSLPRTDGPLAIDSSDRGAASSVGQGGESMIRINQLRLSSAKPRVAQPHR